MLEMSALEFLNKKKNFTFFVLKQHKNCKNMQIISPLLRSAICHPEWLGWTFTKNTRKSYFNQRKLHSIVIKLILLFCEEKTRRKLGRIFSQWSLTLDGEAESSKHDEDNV